VPIPELDSEATVKPDEDLHWLSHLGGEMHSAPRSGTKALMFAVLEDGIRSYLGGQTVARAEAEQWVRSTQRRSAFCFNVVCETLGFEPGAVRLALRRMKETNSPSHALGRSRPNAGYRVPLARARRPRSK
jgi:hypothetical protein